MPSISLSSACCTPSPETSRVIEGLSDFRDYLVDLVDIDDPALCPLDIVVAGLKQLQDDVLDILADIAGLGERRRVGHGEGHVEGPRQRLREQGLAAAGRPDQQDVRFGEFDLGALRAMGEALVMVVHRDREHALGLVLPDHIIVEHVADFERRRHAVAGLDQRRLGFLADDVVAELDAFVADEHGRARRSACAPRAAISRRTSSKGCSCCRRRSISSYSHQRARRAPSPYNPVPHPDGKLTPTQWPNR